MEGGRCDVAFATGLLRPGWAGCDAALAACHTAGLAQPAIVWATGVLECESGRIRRGAAAAGLGHVRRGSRRGAGSAGYCVG